MATSHAKQLPTPRPGQSARGIRRWLLRGGLAATVLALSVVAWLVWERSEASREGQEAVRLARQGRYRDAESGLRRALEYDPDNVELLKPLAVGLLRTENPAEAEQVLTHWCQLRPEQAEPHRLRMDLRHQSAQRVKPLDEQQRLKELALEDGRRVIELEPNDDSTARKVVWFSLASGRFEDADHVCRRYLQRQPDDQELLYLQARVCHARDANAEARALLNKLLARQPQFTPGLLLLAVLHYEADEAERAIPLLRRVIAEGGGSHKEARYHLGLALARAGQTEEAQRVLAGVQRENFEKDTAQPGETESLAVRVRRAELLFGSGRAEEALASLQVVLREDPGYAAAHRLLASYYGQKGESAKAAEHRRLAGRDGVTR
ncbi:MAG TPA: tetratricopeptide repeat protein [Fimbriiglobus sp.]|nr:tetratricopeptide repeat protein [Fimbriiglobus sp.]